MNERIALVILNWNNARDTLSCLESLAKPEYPGCLTYVVDNGSSDDSVERIRAAHPDVMLIETGANLGYAGGNNVGVRKALDQGADFVCILNNDVIVEPDFLEPLVAVLNEQPRNGIATPLVAERVNGGQVWALGSGVNWRTGAVNRRHAGDPVEGWQQRAPFEVTAASGAGMLVKRAVFEQAGLLDESFFLYFEEIDWCLTVRSVGYRILATPSSVVWHKVSATLGTTSPVVDYYMARNHLRLIARHWPWPSRGYLMGWVILRHLLAVAAFTVNAHDGQRTCNRNARLLALRDAVLGRWGKMGPDVERVCYPQR